MMSSPKTIDVFFKKIDDSVSSSSEALLESNSETSMPHQLSLKVQKN